MVLNWVEIGVIVALNAAILAGIATIGIRFFRKRLLPEAEMWMGGAIGRFMANLAGQAAEEEGGSSSGSSLSGALELGGFKIDVGTIKELMKLAPQIMQLAQTFGLLKGGGGGTNPFLHP